MMDLTAGRTRYERLLHWYPSSWRARYGEEFIAMLSAHAEEEPLSRRAALNVRWHGVKARLAATGLRSGSIAAGPDPARTTRAFAAAFFVAAATSIWSQLLIGSSSAPDAHPPVVAVRVVIGATIAVLAAMLIARLSLLPRRIGVAVREHGPRPLAPSLLSVAVRSVAFVGGFAAIWVQVHPPVTVADVSRVTTLSISTYWVHPHALLRLDATFLSWMIVSPIAFLMVVFGLGRLHRDLHPSAPRNRRPWPWRSLALLPTLAVSVWWMLASQPYRSPLVKASTLDIVLVATMTISLLISAAAERTERSR